MATFSVNNTLDSGLGSLRQAILNANATPGADIINFNGLIGPSTIFLTSGQLRITDSLTIESQGNITINAGGTSRVFEINDRNLPDFLKINVLINGLIITGGRVNGGSGGGIFTTANLNLTNSKILGNKAGFDGGGIATVTGNLSIINSTIANNVSDGGGGGIAVSYPSNLFISNSIISGNTARSKGGGIVGGSIARVNNTTIVVKDSTISNNVASEGGGISSNTSNLSLENSRISGNIANGSLPVLTGEGGGILADGNSNVSIINSTISDNIAEDNGGGIADGRDATGAVNGNGLINLINSTISGNTAKSYGGGISNTAALSSISITSSTIAENMAIDGSGIFVGSSGIGTSSSNSIIANNLNNNDLSGNGNFISNRNNLIGNGDGIIGLANRVNGDLIGSMIAPIDPKLGPLQDNGGNTFTQALFIDSPAIDAGNNSLLPPDNFDLNNNNILTEPIPFDQRGIGFDRIFGITNVDIGAFEFQLLNQLIFGNPNNDIVDSAVTPVQGIQNEIFTGAGSDLVDLSGVLALFPNKDYVFLGSGNDEVFISQNDRIFGQKGNDIFYANLGKGNNRLYGNDGNDIFFLGGGDRIVGGNGDDTFYVNGNGTNNADTGGNTISGGAGADQFWVTISSVPNISDLNLITDFRVNVDLIGIGGIVGITEAEVTVTQSTSDLNNAIISVLNTPVVELVGINAIDLNPNSFIIQPNSPTLPII